jgi:hypothetical protein
VSAAIGCQPLNLLFAPRTQSINHKFRQQCATGPCPCTQLTTANISQSCSFTPLPQQQMRVGKFCREFTLCMTSSVRPGRTRMNAHLKHRQEWGTAGVQTSHCCTHILNINSSQFNSWYLWLQTITNIVNIGMHTYLSRCAAIRSKTVMSVCRSTVCSSLLLPDTSTKADYARAPSSQQETTKIC